MVLASDVYDMYGNVLLYQGVRLTLDNIGTLGRMGGGEIFIHDRRVDDVPVTTLIPSRLAGEATRQLRTLFEALRASMKGRPEEPVYASKMEQAVFSMVQQLFPVAIGEVHATGCFSLADYDYVHPVQVTELALLMGRRLGYDQDQLTRLGLVAVLQNVGYLALSKGVMDEPTTLSSIEMHEVRQHSQYGYQIIRDFTRVSNDVAQGILQHHERWDGSGYPRGAKGETISLDARLIGIADTYYALVSRRPHRAATKPHEAVEFIMAYSGQYFDPKLVTLFTKVIQIYPTGVMVSLNTGESGIVVDSKSGLGGRPIVRICYDANQMEWAKPFDIDLSEGEHQHRLVTEVVEY